jgi:hypothetical protein
MKIKIACFFVFALMNFTNPIFADNVGIIVHESVINNLFGALGTIHKDTGVVDVWIRNPKVSIDGDASEFTAQAHVKNFVIDGLFDVVGKVKAQPSYRGDAIKISTYDVIIKDTTFGDVNISDWYDLAFDMPVSIPSETEIANKKINIKQSNFKTIMGQHQIQLYSDIEFLPMD